MIIEEHKEIDNKTWSLQYVTQSIATPVNNTLTDELKKIRLGTNNADKNTQAINDKYFITDLLSTEKHMTSSYNTAMFEASKLNFHQVTCRTNDNKPLCLEVFTCPIFIKPA